jgi:signal transduction histidine kinase/ligand-binding sensor domain-containing protein
VKEHSLLNEPNSLPHESLRASPVFQISANSMAQPRLAEPCSTTTRCRRIRWFVLRLILVLAGSLTIHALEPTTPLANYGRQTWVMENGLPQNTVQTLLQTRDGFVWLGTEVGLVRFDGTGFQVFDRTSSPALPGNDIHCLLQTRDNALWIGTSEGLARWKDGALKVFSPTDSLPANNIRALAEDQAGDFWVYTGEGMARLAGQRFETAGDWRPGAVIPILTAGGQSAPWVDAEPNSVDTWTRASALAGIAKDELQFLVNLNNGLAGVGDKSALVLGGTGGVKTRLTAGRELPGSRIQAVLADHEGSLWIGTNGGLSRWSAGKLDRLPVTDSLASASVLALMEDREGNIWVGSETGGLHILRDQRFKNLGVRDGLASDNTTTVVEDKGGVLWVGTSGSGLTALRPGALNSFAASTYSVKNGLPSDVVLSLAAAPDGDIWVGTPDGLSRIRQGAVTTFTSADGLPDDFIRSLLVDADESLWIATRRGLTHWLRPPDGGALGMQTYTQADGLGSDLVGAMAHDSAGDLWIATFAGLSRLREGKITNFTMSDGLSSNVITALLPRKGTLLIGTQDHGWNMWDGQHFSRVTRDNLRNTSIHAILDDGHNHLWFATGNGIARCDCAGIAGAMEGVDCMNWIEFGTADGLMSRETATNSHPSAWQATNGRLWFATPKGLESVDPAHFPVNLVPPPVALERFAVDDVSQPLSGTDTSIRVPAGHNHFQFEYAGLSFVAPQKVRYRFMLEGFDHSWTEAGSRRTAYYTNIPPGTYTFRVQASNNDGVWNTQGAELAFELRPHFYQTVWFYALMALALAGLVVLLLRLRLLRAEREFRAVLGERNRIAREIHDTLAQGYVGISVQLEVLSELLRHKKLEDAAKHLDKTRGYVREGLDDARQSIWSLRSQDAAETTLPVQMRRLVEHAEGHGLEAKFNIHGAYRPMPPGTEREILRVAQEAIHNVKKHAAAHNLVVQLEYGASDIALEVRDDGRGFDADHVSGNGTAPGAPGHYGLTGMRERAAAIGGTLEVTSTPGSGTTVRLRTSDSKAMKELV